MTASALEVGDSQFECPLSDGATKGSALLIRGRLVLLGQEVVGGFCLRFGGRDTEEREQQASQQARTGWRESRRLLRTRFYAKPRELASFPVDPTRDG